MGSVVAMRAAAIAPEKVRSMTVIEPPALPNGAGRPGADQLIDARRGYWSEADPTDLAGFAAGFLNVLGIDLAFPSPAGLRPSARREHQNQLPRNEVGPRLRRHG